jgi:2-desacetyl-2-hydroxyethyl bacteriochlorophyllide A dehydrogenase
MKIKQLIFPRKLNVEAVEVDIPDDPGPGEIIVENSYGLISPGTELAMFAETHIGFPDPDFTYAKFPFRPGYATVGRAVKVGDGVSGISEGDCVFHRGLHASHSLVPAIGPRLKVPDGVPEEHAPFAAMLHVALTSVRLSNIRLGYNVAVFGQGLVGNFAAQLMRASGAMQVIAVDTVAERLEISRACGVDVQINAAIEDAVQRIKEITGGSGAQIVVEATGNPQVASSATKSAAQMGQVILLGSPRGTAEVDLYFDLHRPGVSMIGAHAGRQADARQFTDPEPHELLLHLIARGKLVIAPVHTHTLAAAEADRAYNGLLNEKETYLGVLLDLNQW